jgi:EAL domain-containing protein (putative c-di-GMP-specific phosphodiesterase class I)
MEDLFSFNGYEQPLLLYAQRKATKDGKTVGFEVLLRAHSEDRAMSEVVEHFEVVENIHELTLIVFRLVCKQAKKIFDRGIKMQVSVNIAPASFGDKFLTDELSRVLDEVSIAPEFVTLEITERQELEKRCFPELQKLTEKCFVLAIDDFGSGRFTDMIVLENLKKCGIGIKEIKLDKIYLNDFNGLKDTANLLLENGYEVTVEGVETQTQLELLPENVNVQGYVYGKPKPLSKLIDDILKSEVVV